MFNRYWRTYPWALQVFLFFVIMFTVTSFATFLVLALIPKISGITLTDIINISPLSSPRIIRAGLITQAVSHMGMFAIPALLFAAFTHPRLREYLGLRGPARSTHWLFVTSIMIGLIPFCLWGETWMAQHLHLGKLADEAQQKNDSTFKAFLNLPNPGDFALLLTVMAFLPAIGEELVFRGVLLRLIHRGFNRSTAMLLPANAESSADPNRSMVFPVILSAFLFAGFHSNPYGFTFIFISGCVLALIYSLTGSLLCSMWGHLLFNGLQVAAVYLTRHDAAAQKVVEGANLPIIYPIIGLIIFGLSFYALVRTQTPLPPNWSDDFRPDELELQKQE